MSSMQMLAAMWLVAGLSAREGMRRGAVLLLSAGVTMLMALSPWLAIFALGDELDVMQEMGLAQLGVGGAVIGVVLALPASRAQAESAASEAMLATPVAAQGFALARWMGTAAVILLHGLLWFAVFMASLWVFAHTFETRFTLGRETDVVTEFWHLLPRAALACALSVVLAAVALAAGGWGRAGARSVLAPLLAVVLLPLLAGALHAHAADSGLGLVLRVLGFPLIDPRLYWPDLTLYAELDWRWVLGGIVQALAFGAAVVLLFAPRPR